MAKALPDTTLWRCAAFQKWMNPQHAFSHVTAARLYGLPLPDYTRPDRRLHVSSPEPLRPPQGRGIRGHEVSETVWDSRVLVLRDEQNGMLCGLPVCSPVLVWAQLSTLLDPDDLVAVGDALLANIARPDVVTGSGPLTTIDELREASLKHAGRRGARAMAEAAPRVRFESLSRPESLLRLIIVRAGYPEPLPNVQVTDLAGLPIAMADLCWPQFRVLIEYEGDLHRKSKSKFRSDLTRGETYADGEWFQLRASAEDVFHDPNPFLARLGRRLTAAGWRPTRRERGQIAASRP